MSPHCRASLLHIGGAVLLNASGNFLFDTFQDRTPINFPITARVVKGDKERKMLTAQMSGDCNSCHSQSGAEGAPGRIVAP
ncbi:hypothetical protein [Sorangium sp. So ce1153]|uniref:hypothetical protein n=1 Tax=Sorangium sp. So ce1153 TaxID=3133333 RepID=UPI003F62DD0D